MDSKYFKKFYEVGNNAYYLFKVSDDIYIVSESFLEFERPIFKKILKPKRITQDMKMLEMTAPIGMLFDNILNLNLIEKDEEFPDMSKFEKLDGDKVRKEIKDAYVNKMKDYLEDLEGQFRDFIIDIDYAYSNGEINEEEYNERIKINTIRHNDIIKSIKENNSLNGLELNIPRGSEYNNVVKKMISEGLEFLYTQKVGIGLKITYLYELDDFGTLTIYKLQIVKGVLKKVETFIYNMNIIRELVGYMANHKM